MTNVWKNFNKLKNDFTQSLIEGTLGDWEGKEFKEGDATPTTQDSDKKERPEKVRESSPRNYDPDSQKKN